MPALLWCAPDYPTTCEENGQAGEKSECVKCIGAYDNEGVYYGHIITLLEGEAIPTPPHLNTLNDFEDQLGQP